MLTETDFRWTNLKAHTLTQQSQNRKQSMSEIFIVIFKSSVWWKSRNVISVKLQQAICKSKRYFGSTMVWTEDEANSENAKQYLQV